jgi:hypothetical protein
MPHDPSCQAQFRAITSGGHQHCVLQSTTRVIVRVAFSASTERPVMKLTVNAVSGARRKASKGLAVDNGRGDPGRGYRGTPGRKSTVPPLTTSIVPTRQPPRPPFLGLGVPPPSAFAVVRHQAAPSVISWVVGVAHALG